MPCPHARFAKRLAVGGTVVIAACLLAAGGLTDPSQPSIPFITPEHTETPLPTPTQVAEPSATPGPADAPWPQAMAYYVGWAVFAYPGDSQVAMATALRRMKDSGANVAWIGHNNPGEVMENKVEPGLSFAVYLAAQDPASPDHATAQAMMDAQHRMLRAAREVGLPVVFPVGYQMQVGRAWNNAHPQALRRYAGGQPLDIFQGGVSASPYSPEYRASMRAYYRWVRDEFVMPYRDVILMLNLADEPLGGDYSPAAEAEFRARYGTGFDEASPAEIGAFQDRVIVDYAIWSAGQWADLAPGLPVTMSFDGAQGRWSYHMPEVEALFRDTPPNFIPSFDAYLHDDPAFKPLTQAEVGALTLFARSLGYYSARYQRELWLWSAGNRWGLAADSANPGGVGDAVANGYLVAVAVRSTGGLLRGIAVWNYNVQHQGLFGDGEPAPYHRGAMFEHLSAAFNDWRAIMVAPGGQTTMLVLMSEGWAQAYLGQTRQAVRGSPLDFGRLLPLARADVPLAVVGALPSLEGIHTVAVLDPTPAYLTPSDLIHLAIFVAGGGRLLATQAVSRALISELQNMWIDRMGRGRVWGLPDDLATLDESGWAQALPGEMVAPEGLLVSTRTWALFYPIDGRAERLPPRRTWRVFGPHGMLFEPIAMVQAHDFALAP